MSTTSKLSSTTSSTIGVFNPPSITSTSTGTSVVREAAGADAKGAVANGKKARKQKSNDPIMSIAFFVVMQSAIVALILVCIEMYFKKEAVVDSAMISACCQIFLWIILVCDCCFCFKSSVMNGIVIFSLLLIGILEFCIVFYVSLIDEFYDCTHEDCEYFGKTTEKTTFIVLHATFGLIHAVYLAIFFARLSGAPKKRNGVVTVPSKKVPPSQKQQQLQTHPVRQLPSRSRSLKPRSLSSRSLPYRSRSRSVSTRSIASSQFPETSSIRSYVPPFNLQQYALPSSISCAPGQCPIAASQCYVPECPYYRQRHPIRQTSPFSQGSYPVVPYQRSPSSVLPYAYSNAQANVGYDHNRALVIDLPQRYGAPENVVGNGTVEIQRIIINMPSDNNQSQVHQQANRQPLPINAAPPRRQL